MKSPGESEHTETATTTVVIRGWEGCWGLVVLDISVGNMKRLLQRDGGDGCRAV